MSCHARQARGLGAVLALALVLCSVDAHAQDVDADFARGLVALRQGHDEDAVTAFEAAYAHAPQPIALLNLGIAYTRLGRIERALDALTRYVETADANHDALNIKAVQTEIERLRSMQPQHLPSPPAPPPAPPPSAAEPLQVPEEHETVAPSPAADEGAAPAPTPGCSLGSVCLGPVLALGLPNLVGGGVQIRFGDYFGAGISFQVLPTLPVLDLGSVRTTLFTAEGRIYPFGGSLFLAAGFSHQAATAEASTDGVSAEASVAIPAFFAGIGLLGHDGAVLGVDIGLIVPLSGTHVRVRRLSSNPAGETDAAVAKVEGNAKHRAQKFVDLLPCLLQLNLLRLGYLF